MNIFKSKASIELERLSLTLDGLALATNTQLKEKTERRMMVIHLSRHESKLKALADALGKQNVEVTFNSVDLSSRVSDTISVNTKDINEEVNHVANGMNVITDVMFRTSIAVGVMMAGTMTLSLFDTVPTIYLSVGTTVSMIWTILGKLKVARMEKDLIKEVLNLRVVCMKEVQRLKIMSTEINSANTFLVARNQDIGESIKIIEDLINKKNFDQQLQEEFMVANAIINQVLYHIEEDLEGE